MPFLYCTYQEISRINRTLGNPTIKATGYILRRASGDELDRETREPIYNISQGCGILKIHAATPRRFKLTRGTNDLLFNHVVQIDTMFIHNRQILRMVDTAKNLCAESFFRSHYTKEI